MLTDLKKENESLKGLISTLNSKVADLEKQAGVCKAEIESYKKDIVSREAIHEVPNVIVSEPTIEVHDARNIDHEDVLKDVTHNLVESIISKARS